MRPDRQMAIEAMRNMGWSADRIATGKHPSWKFRREDTGGLYDVVSVKQANLSMSWVADIAMAYGDADELLLEICAAKDAWLQRRFLGIFKRASESQS